MNQSLFAQGGASSSHQIGACPIHPGVQFQYISIDPNQQQAFKCVNCTWEHNLENKTLIPINKILSAAKDYQFENFSLPNHDLVKKAIFAEQAILNQFDAYLNDFKDALTKRISVLQTGFKRRLQSIGGMNIVVDNASRIYSTELIKNIIVDPSKSIDAKSNELKALCAQLVQSESQIESSSIKSTLHTLESILKKNNQADLESIKPAILKQFDSIEAEIIQRTFEQNSPFVYREQPIISKLMKLIQAPFNDISLEKRNDFEIQLQQIRFAVSVLKIPDVGPTCQKLETFTPMRKNLITSLINDLSSLPNVPEMGLFQAEKVNSTILKKLIENKTNYLSTEDSANISGILDKLNGIIQEFKVAVPKPVKINYIDKIETAQLDLFQKLAQKSYEFVGGGHFGRATTEAEHLAKLVNSNLILKRINYSPSIQSKNKMSTFINQIEKLFINFPIFELLPNLNALFGCEMEIERTMFKQSEHMQISENASSQILLKQPPNTIGQVVSKVLDNNKAYRVSVTLSFPKGKLESPQGVLIGLIPDSRKDAHNVLSGEEECGFYTRKGWSNGQSRVLKGKNINTEEIKGNLTLEFTFCVSQQLFFIEEKSKSAIEQWQKFKTDETYRFAICFYKVQNEDYTVSINKFYEINISEVIPAAARA